MMTDDMELVREYTAHQSEPAFETLVNRYVNLVYSAALRRVNDPHLAEEVTQAVFIILARKAGSLGPKTILPSWLHRAGCFVAADVLRSRRRRTQREQEAYMQSMVNDPPPGADEAWRQIAPLLDTAIADLSEKDRHAIVLRFFENRTLDEVGRALGGNEDAARMRVRRALEKLRVYFFKRGVSSTTEIIAGAISANSVQVAPMALAKSVTAVAVAKGAAATASTLTCIKGALKLMAWTKAKMAIVTGAVVLAAGTGTIIIYNGLSAQPIAKPLEGIPKDWYVMNGSLGQWDWSNNAINGHSTNGDSILASTKQYGDVTISAMVNTTNRGADLAFRMQDANNGYVLCFAPDGTPWAADNGSHIQLRKRVSGEESDVATFTRRGLPQSAKLTILARGPRIEVRLNDITVLKTNDSTFPSGFIGARVYGDPGKPDDATFSNVTFH
jgi:RNA polymerase sigma factor (sigma-70 family)